MENRRLRRAYEELLTDSEGSRSILSALYKSYLAKGASRRIFWARHILRHLSVTETHQLDLLFSGFRDACQNEIDAIKHVDVLHEKLVLQKRSGIMPSLSALENQIYVVQGQLGSMSATPHTYFLPTLRYLTEHCRPIEKIFTKRNVELNQLAGLES
jgi:hypothetical protein